MKNPHFDEGLLVWSDEYSGRYGPPPKGYSEQFDLQWKLAFGGDPEHATYAGACTGDEYIDDRIYEWTGTHPKGRGFAHQDPGVKVLERPIDPDLIRGKECIDLGCGMGRWTKTMLGIGAKSVLSVDMSESGLESTRTFNSNVLRADLMRLDEEHPELAAHFDFGNLWGVAMCTHDPLRAFLNAAATIRPGGALYLMVYAPQGIHGQALTNIQRRKFHSLKDFKSRMRLIDDIVNRRWDPDYPLAENLKNLLRRLRGLPKSNKNPILDLLSPFYNWVIPMPVIKGWMKKGGFSRMTVLNPSGTEKAAHHVLGIKA
ncbi:MAG: class I SAM-dependent methyltransferase [Desulfovibrionaceae bacterium]|nr:class I SAM-dependent methyltransferase [Desulfovibrionaceae bacterium]